MPAKNIPTQKGKLIFPSTKKKVIAENRTILVIHPRFDIEYIIIDHKTTSYMYTNGQTHKQVNLLVYKYTYLQNR